MATKLQDKVGPASLHDQDFYDWAKNQAAALRKLQAQRPNLPLDFEHLIEEVEDLAKTDCVRPEPAPSAWCSIS
jgi:hypothetical protein